MRKSDHLQPGFARPDHLILTACFFAAGIAWEQLSSQAPDSFSCWTITILLAISILSAHLFSQTKIACCLIPPFFFMVGALYAEPVQPPADPFHVSRLIDQRQEVSLTGVLKECPSLTEGKSRMLMEVERLQSPNGLIRSTGLVLLFMHGHPPADLLPGDRFMVRAKVSRPRNYSNPGGFDYKTFLGRKSIWITGWVSSPALMTKVHTLRPSTLLKSCLYLPARIRYSISNFLDSNLDGRVRGLYKTILIGDRNGVAPEVLENFKAAGCFHLLAISGLHMGLLAIVFTTLLYWFLKRSTWILLHTSALKMAAMLSLLPLTGYALVAGFQTPVVRALLMTSVFILATLIDRQRSVPTNIAIAALIVLIWKPSSLQTVSFQLSFAAVLAIAIMYPAVSHLLTPPSTLSMPAGYRTRIKKWAVAGIALSMAATLGTAPLLLLHFNRFSPLSPLSTLAVEPFLCFWSLLVGLAACLMIPVSTDLAGFLFEAGSWGIIAAEKITAFLAGLPGSSLWLPTPTWLEIICYYTALAGLIYRKRFRFAAPVGILGLIILIVSPLAIHYNKRLWRDTAVTVLDVGQGSSTLLQLPHGHAILIDGGGPRSRRFNVGDRIIAPFLWKKRIRRLKGVVISHPHADHYNGLFFIIDKFKPETLWINGRTSNDPEYDKLLERARQRGIQVVIPQTGALLHAEDNIRLRCVGGLHLPDASISFDTEATVHSAQNAQSLVLRLESENIAFLFPGDIERCVEEKLVAGGVKIRADVLLAAHHGSRTSNSIKFLKKVSPRYLIISAGPQYRPVFPDPALINTCGRLGITAFNTGRTGAVSFVTDGRTLGVKISNL